MSNYPGFPEKLKRRLELITPPSDDLEEAKATAAHLISRLTDYFKDSKENHLSVKNFELVGAVAEGTIMHKVPEFDYLMMIRPPWPCRLSDPEPPMGRVEISALTRRTSITANMKGYMDNLKVLGPPAVEQLFTLVKSALEYRQSVPGSFPKHKFQWRQVKSDRPQEAPTEQLLEGIDKRTGNQVFLMRFWVCLEVDEDGAKSYAVACGDGQWRLNFDIRDRDRLSGADKADAGYRLACCTLMKSLLCSTFPKLAAYGRAALIAKALLHKEMHETSNAASKWRQEFFGDRFFSMLERLCAALAEGRLDHAHVKFMGGRANLLEDCAGLAEARADIEAKVKSPDSKLLIALTAV